MKFMIDTLKKKFILYLGAVLFCFLTIILSWMYIQGKQSIMALLDQQARTLLAQVIITRAWVADHGGLFVKKQEGVESNPFLPATNISDQQGNTYCFRNPAMVTREISSYAEQEGLYRLRLTSLKLKNLSNAPLPFEVEALRSFEEMGYERAGDGIASVGRNGNADVYRRIVPLRVDESCLECHADQGYSVGEVRGGLSVMIPMDIAQASLKRNRLTFFGLWLGIIVITLGVVYILLRRLVLVPVDHLCSVANRLIEGEYSARASLETNDEFECLSQAFNGMTDRLKNGYAGALKSLIAAMDARDPYTKGHTARVAHYSVCIARELGLSKSETDEIEIGAILHDIGKIGISDTLLNKPTPLEGEEVAIMESHVEAGAKIIREADFLLFALPAILHHHERFDGKGYPNRLTENQLSLMARIIAVADTYDAITTKRPYSKAMPPAKAFSELRKHAGTQFDPEIVKAFERVILSEKRE